MKRFLPVLAALAFAPSAFAAVPTPGVPQERPIAIVGATIHPVAGPVILSGTVVFDHGKIVSVGTGAAPPGEDRA